VWGGRRATAQVFAADYVDRTILGEDRAADAATAKTLHSET
jgi:hypothetical protein